jgi:hypothetical protein
MSMARRDDHGSQSLENCRIRREHREAIDELYAIDYACCATSGSTLPRMYDLVYRLRSGPAGQTFPESKALYPIATI